MNIVITPGSFIHQTTYMQFANPNGTVFVCGPSNENTMITMNTMTYASPSGSVFVTWMYF